MEIPEGKNRVWINPMAGIAIIVCQDFGARHSTGRLDPKDLYWYAKVLHKSFRDGKSDFIYIQSKEGLTQDQSIQAYKDACEYVESNLVQKLGLTETTVVF